ncbi:MAG: transcription antitermination factor NusB [Chthoniobacteraceae bacterium]
MSKRREGREAAIQYLYQLEIHGDRAADLTADFWNMCEAKPAVREYANNLIAGVNAHIADVDERIKKYAINFEIGRLAAVDRNILRLAIYEMLYCMETPPIVAINEALEIAKKFGGEDSARFVNGILDKVKGELTRPLREAARPGAKPAAQGT